MDLRGKLDVIAHLGDHITYKEEYGICYDSALAKVIEDAYITLKNDVTVQEWIPVSEGLPTEEAEEYEKEWGEPPEYLVMIDRGYLPTTLYYDWENGVWYKINSALKKEEYNVTHWMPLPEPPKREA